MSSLRRPGAAIGLVLLALWVLVAIFADLIASDLPLLAADHGRLQLFPREAAAWDWSIAAPLGRAHSALGRTVHAARGSALMTLAVLAIAIPVGFAGGALAGGGTRLPDALLSRAVELAGALPALVVLGLLRTERPVADLASFVLVVALFSALEIARLVRGEVLRVSGQDFILAARALGVPSWRIAWTHVLPHVSGPVLVAATFTVGGVVAMDAALSFVGLGLHPDVQSWGALLAPSAPERATPELLPALAIVAVTVACWLVADALDDAVSARRGRSRAW